LDWEIKICLVEQMLRLLILFVIPCSIIALLLQKCRILKKPTPTSTIPIRAYLNSEFFDTANYDNVKFTILGGGAFSLALSNVLAYKNISSSLLVRNETVAQHINQYRYHPKYLPDCQLPHQLTATCDPVEAFKGATYIVHAVPMQQSRSFLTSMKPYIPGGVPILSVAKGVEQGTFCLMNDVIEQTLGHDTRAAFLSGPSFAKEMMEGHATAVVIASTDISLAKELADIFSSVKFRCHTSSDVKVRFPFFLKIET
jgi:glycerol-3-phosphate dehydrogenase (NAD+)